MGDAPPQTSGATTPDAGIDIRSVELSFVVSCDEEYVRIFMKHDHGTIDMGDRAHNYLLLLLARQRLDDLAAGLPDASCGWIHQDDWLHDPSLAPARVNLDIFRIRKQFAERAVFDARRIVERRPRTRQLRMGVERLSIEHP